MERIQVVLLVEQKDFNLGTIAMARAYELGHPKARDPEMLVLMDSNGFAMQGYYTNDEMQRFFDEGAAWREAYAQEELALLERGFKPTFATMKRKTKIHDKKFFPPKPELIPKLAMTREEKQTLLDVSTIFGAFVVICLLLVWLGVRVHRRKAVT